MVDFREGVKFCFKNQDSILAERMGDAYIDSINDKINELTNHINKFRNYETPIDKLKGNVAEFWHADTLNINSVINNNKTNAIVPENNRYASSDIEVDGNKYGLKYYQTAEQSAKAQAISHFEMYKRTYPNNEISFEKFLKERNVSEIEMAHDPIYKEQMRVIPSDQLEQAKEFLLKKIEKEKVVRPELVKKNEDTYEKLTDVIKDKKGNESIRLNKKDAEKLAKLAKKGKFDPKDFDLTTEELVKYDHIFKQAFKAGITAMTISIVIKIAPEIYNAIKYLLETGEMDERQFKKIGYAAMQGGQEGFLRGFISASIVSCCESGKWGSALKGVDPSIIGVSTVLAVNTLKNATEVAKGNMSRGEMVNELIKDLFVTTGAMSLGTITQEIIPIPVLGFMIGSFAGSMVGTFVYNAGYSTAMSFFVESGITVFGLVEQDYELPENVLEEMGIETFNFDRIDYERLELEKFVPKTCDVERFVPDTFEPEEFNIRYLRRGVIEINRIGYVV